MGPVIEVTKSFTFDAAHRLMSLPEDHKCHRLHGHTYAAVLGVEGTLDQRTGFVGGFDFADLERIFDDRVHSVLDHRYLNDVPGLEVPSCERLAWWIYDQLKAALPLLSWVRVHESSTTSATYRGVSRTSNAPECSICRSRHGSEVRHACE